MAEEYRITGSIITSDQKPLVNFRIEAWDTTNHISKAIGETVSDENGKFEMNIPQLRFAEWFPNTPPDMYFKLYRNDKLIHNTASSVIWNARARRQDMEIVVNTQDIVSSSAAARPKLCTVFGCVTDANKRPQPNLSVQVYDVDMRSWQTLGSTETDRSGRYEIQWEASNFTDRGKKTADIALRIFSGNTQAELYKTPMDEVRYNSGEREEMNITIAASASPGISEFDRLARDIAYLAGDTPVTDLQENDTYRDVTFLSHELEVPAEKIERFAVAHRLQSLSEAEASFFYALLRKHTLAEGNGSGSKIQTTVTLGTDGEMLLFEFALADEEKIKTDLSAAVAEGIVNEESLKTIKRNLAILARFRQKATDYYKDGRPEKVIQWVSRMLNPSKILEVDKLFSDSKNNLNGFLETVSDPAFYSERQEDNTAIQDVLSSLFNVGKEATKNIVKDNKIRTKKDLQKLARFDKKKWLAELEKAKPAIKDKTILNNYASAIVRQFENAFPTTAFAAQLERSDTEVINNQPQVVSFLNKHEDFDLVKSNVDLFIKDKKIAAKTAAAVSDEIKSVQRIFKLVPNYSKTVALRGENIHSAYSIVSAGKSRFVSEIAPKAGLSPAEAETVYRKAEAKHTSALLTIGNIRDSLSAVSIASLETAKLEKKIAAVSQDFPNLSSLFKLTDACECEHCRSVYSPAAYLVEILQFLDKRAVVAGNAKTVLFNRRPDLGEIDLGCENAETPVRYIDLVCEILEDAVAPDAGIAYTGTLTDGADASKGKISTDLFNVVTAAGLPVTTEAIIYETEAGMVPAATLPHYLRDGKLVCKIVNTGVNQYTVYRLRQTFSTADELDAAPEYVNPDAYNVLLTQKYAFRLPFDLFHTEAKAYLDRFDIPRDRLMKTFQVAGSPADANIAAENTGLTDSERQLIVTTPAPDDNTAQQAFWNVPAPGDVLDYLKQADHFLTKTGLSFKDLERLLQLRFIRGGTDLFIYNDDLSCDTAKKEIKNLDLDVLDRMHRFLRLQKKTGWKFETLDEIISQSQLGQGNLNDDCIEVAASLQNLSAATGLKLEELVCCYGEIPHQLAAYQKTTLYDSVFQNKAKTGFIEPGLSAEAVAANEVAAVKQPLTLYKTAISTIIGIKEPDFDALVASLPNSDLSFANLSRLYAIGRWMKKQKMSASDFFILQELTGIDAFASPGKTLAFYEAAMLANTSPLKLADVKFMLRHEADNVTEREMKPDRIAALLQGLQAGFQKSFNDHRSPYNDNLNAEDQKETLKNELSKLPLLSEADISILLNFADASWAYSWTDEQYHTHTGTNAADAVTFLSDKKIASLFSVASITTALNALQTPHNNLVSAASALEAAEAANAGIPAAQSNFDAAQSAWNTAQKAFIKAWLDAISQYLFVTEKVALANALVASACKAGNDTTAILLGYAKLKQVAPGTDVLLDILTSDALIDTGAVTAAHPQPVLPAITEAAFPKQYGAVRLLHKLFPLINSFGTDAAQTGWFLTHNDSLGWLAFDVIPFAAAQTPVVYSAYTDFRQALGLLSTLTPVVNPADADQPVSFFSLLQTVLAATATQDEFMQAMSTLTGYEKESLSDIDTYLFTAFNLNTYKAISNWKRLLDCAEDLRILNATLMQVTGYIQPTLTAGDAATLRTSLKTRYDEDTWLSTLKEIMDKIRPQKRDALIAYLLAVNPDIKDENDLYEFFLMDVQMESCMPSSRIVLAHNSIQLFVQRCMMGLEPDAMADVDKDTGWKQWQWMKNYRVWEANRKIFLYPENWYDVTLADDKSFQLTEFINELQQNELTNDTAEESIRNYLGKLDGIAFLEVKATWYDVPSRTMHVFARTKGGDPAIYYYRRFEKESVWTPWEKVELDIQGDQLLAFMRNDRLHLSWLMFSEDTQPDQQSKVPSSGDQGTFVTPDKPKKKLIVQLAISEYSNKKWQTKRVSKDSIATPTDYTNDYSLLDRKKYNMLYFQAVDQIYIFSSRGWENRDYLTKNGVFSIAGCKGYPEKVFEGYEDLPDFLPDVYAARLQTQRYNEITEWGSFPLSVKSGAYPFGFLELLGETPGQFRISYPHQLTVLDMLSLMYQVFGGLLTSAGATATTYQPKRGRGMKIPVGTLLPYFMEDSWHSYVIIPGFYTGEYSGGEFPRLTGLSDESKRTASDVFQLLDDMINWIKKIWADFTANPPADAPTAIHIILTDPDFQAILQEMSAYAALQPLLQLLIGNTGEPEFDEKLKAMLQQPGLLYGEAFKNMYHPLVCSLRKTLYGATGVSGLMNRATQLQVNTEFNFASHYKPVATHVAKQHYKQPDGSLTEDYPIEDISFTSDDSYSLYNWDLFFRIPLHIAGSLTANQRFEEALTWFHYIFNPTGALPGNGVQKYWVTKPFYLNQEADYMAQRIDSLLYNVSDASGPDSKELEFAIEEWRTKPFRPDVVARFRPVAYQKAVLMKYIDNLTAWGDYLFRQDTMESIAQATQMYVLADKLLGPKPRMVPPVVKPPYETYNQMEAKIDSFGNALIALENILPDIDVLPHDGEELPPPPVTLSMLYFCIPQNEQMTAYWDRIADRLFKIRHCQNIDGVERSLALFAPPIDPGMLVKAAASGLDLSSIIAGLNAPSPFYRFTMMSQKATEFVQEVRALGNSLLQALEKKDAEALTLLRNKLEINVLNAVKEIKKMQISEATEQIEILNRTKKVTEERHGYYRDIQKISSKEQLNLTKLGEAHGFQLGAQVADTFSGIMALIPDLVGGASGFGGSPHVVVQWGGANLLGAAKSAADVLRMFGTIAAYEANRASTLGGFDRRFDDWKLQERLAKKELDSIEKQISAAGIRKEIAESDLKNQELQIDNAKKTDEFMRSKFTNKELYDWMIGQISGVYFKSYQLAHEMAKKAERCYRFELGNDDSFISYGYWDSLKKGLLSADNLLHDIKRMETTYLDKNKREYELTKHVSLSLLDPLALISLRATGKCDFEIPEALYDMDYAGHYFRRIKSVSLSLPCIAGPYTTVSAKLSLVNNRYRKNTNPDNAAATGYAEDPGNDERFLYNTGAIQSIAASQAQNDSGLFELSFRDERYLPFENTGAISSWRLELPDEVRQFDYNSIAEVVVHVKYTAREGGSSLKTAANDSLKDQLAIIRQGLKRQGLHTLLNMKHDLPNEWYLLKQNGFVNLTIGASRLPYMAQTVDVAVENVVFVAQVADDPNNFQIVIDDANPPVNLSKVSNLHLCAGNYTGVELGTDFKLAIAAADKAKLQDLTLVIKYSL